MTAMAATPARPSCQPNQNMNGSPAFTLIEILVTVAIIAILVAFLFPAIAKGLDAARGAKCVSNLRQLMVAVEFYRGDNNRYPQSYGGDRAWWDNLLTGGYIKSVKEVTCPSGGYLDTNDPNVGADKRRSYGGYGYTSLFLWADGARTDAVKNFFTARLSRRSMWPLIMDADYLAVYDLDNPVATSSPGNRFTARHGDYANVLMADGHIEKAKYGDKRWRQSELNNGKYYQ